MRIIDRYQWGASFPDKMTPRDEREIIAVCYHHSDTRVAWLFKAAAAIVRSIQKYHMRSRGYSDIAYNALIDSKGRIYEGRSTRMRGAHSDGEWQGGDANTVCIGVCFIGNFYRRKLTKKQKEAALAYEYITGLRLGRPLGYCTHRETKATGCPGDRVQAWIESRRAG